LQPRGASFTSADIRRITRLHQKSLAVDAVDQVEQSWRAASYEERILKGENLDNLPMQAPTKFELNLKTAHRGRIGCSRSQRDDRMTRREFVTWLARPAVLPSVSSPGGHNRSSAG
jgi:hypothetical protein